MSTEAEKIESIMHAVNVSKKIVEKLELIQSCSKLCKSQQYELDMARDCVERGRKVLAEFNKQFEDKP